MKQFVWKKSVGHERIKSLLSSAFAGQTLGHAYLFCGEEGCGTFSVALETAFALLCNHAEQVPCYTCDACTRIMRGNHPGLHIMMPVTLKKEHKSSDNHLSTEGWEYLQQSIRWKIEHPYRTLPHTGLPHIPVEWVREVNQSILRGTIDGGPNIALISGIETMKKESANAMLKTLEEPPPNTIMFLCTEHAHRVLPTIRSRCQILRFGTLDPETIRRALAQSAPDDGRTLENALFASEGSLGKVLEYLENPLDDVYQQAREFFDALVRGDWSAVTTCVDTIAGNNDVLFFEHFFRAVLFGVRNELFGKVPGAEKYIYGSFCTKDAVNANRPVAATERIVMVCERALGDIRSHTNPHIVCATAAFALMETIHREKQQTR